MSISFTIALGTCPASRWPWRRAFAPWSFAAFCKHNTWQQSVDRMPVMPVMMSWWSPAPRPSGGFPKWEMGLGVKQRETTHYPSGNRFFNVLLILLALHLTKGSLHARHEDSCVMLLITDERAGKVRHLQAADDMQHGLLGNPWNIPKVGMIWVVKLCLSSRAGLSHTLI